MPSPGEAAGRRAGARAVARRPAPRPGAARRRRPPQRRRPLPLLADRGDRRRPRRAAGTRSTSRSRTGSTTSTSARSCAPRTPSWPPRCTSSAAAAGTAAARWSPTATSTSATTPRRRLRRWARGEGCRSRHRQRPGLRAARDVRAARGAACCCSGRRARGCRRRRARRERTFSIRQFGSTRSINAAAAARSRCTSGSAAARPRPSGSVGGMLPPGPRLPGAPAGWGGEGAGRVRQRHFAVPGRAPCDVDGISDLTSLRPGAPCAE